MTAIDALRQLGRARGVLDQFLIALGYFRSGFAADLHDRFSH